MAIKLGKRDRLRAEVMIYKPLDDNKYQEAIIHVTYKYFTTSQFEKEVLEGGEDLSRQDVIERYVMDIEDLEEEDGSAFVFSPERAADICEYEWLRDPIFNEFLLIHRTEARRKNL